MRIDIHTHTWRCRHATGTLAEYVDSGRSADLDVIALTEHLPLPAELDPLTCYAMPAAELSDHLAQARRLAVETRDLEVLVGIEADWLPEHRRHVESLLARCDLDVILGSVHMLDGWAFDDPDLIESWDARAIEDVWQAYFETLCDAAASGMYDVMAHPDLVKKFGHRPVREPLALFDDVAAELARAGVAIEVSSAGLRKPVGEIYPGPALLAACCRAGVAATTGSDAHTPHEVGHGLDLVQAALHAAGYTTIVSFKGRERREVAL